MRDTRSIADAITHVLLVEIAPDFLAVLGPEDELDQDESDSEGGE